MTEFIRPFTVTFDVANPIEFAASPEASSLSLARKHYQGKCFKGVHVGEVIKILQMSQVILNTVGDIAAGTINVEFAARCSRYSKDDLALMKIETRAQFTVGSACGDKAPPLTLSLLSPNEVLSVGMIVPVRLGVLKYSPTQATPVGVAELLAPARGEHVWKVVTPPEGEATRLEALIDNLGKACTSAAQAEASLLEKLGEDFQTSRDFFSKLYSAQGAARGGDIIDQFGMGARKGEFRLNSVEDVRALAAALVPGTAWTFPPGAPFGTAGPVPAPEAETPNAVPPSAALAALVGEATCRRRLITALASEFAGPAGRQRQNAVWQLARLSRR